MLLYPIALALTIISAPATIPNERGSIVVSDQHGSERWTADFTMEPSREGGLPAVRFTENGRGRYSPYSQPVQWMIESVWTASGEFQPLRFERTVKDLNGRTITTERKTFDTTRHNVKFERQSQASGPVNKEIHVPADTLAVEG